MHHLSGYLLTYTKQSLAYGGGGGGGGGAQPDAKETIYFILFICKCFNNNKGVTVCNWCYNCWNNPTNKQTSSGPQRKAQVNSDPDTVKKGVDFCKQNLQYKRIQYKSNSQSYIGFIYIYNI
jgi:hypothetical protein